MKEIIVMLYNTSKHDDLSYERKKNTQHICHPACDIPLPYIIVNATETF